MALVQTPRLPHAVHVDNDGGELYSEYLDEIAKTTISRVETCRV
jgi:hypothetical protein